MHSAFPASYSTLSADALASLVTDRYALPDVQCTFLLRGVGDTYLIETNDNKFILRVYRSTHRKEVQIKAEVDLLLALKEAAVSIAFPVKDVSGTLVQVIDAIEGKRCAVLFSFASGVALHILNDNQLRELGKQMARFHNVSSLATNSENQRWDIDLDTTLFEPLALLQAHFTADLKTYNWLQQAAKQVERKLGQLDTATFSKGYCHYDMLPKNFHFDGDNITFFDFDFMGYGWLVNDLMIFWQHLYLDVHFGRLTQKAADHAYALVVDSYREQRALTEQELAAVPYLSLGFWLFYSGFHTTHDQFYQFIHPAHLTARFGFVRKMMERYWEQEYLPG